MRAAFFFLALVVALGLPIADAGAAPEPVAIGEVSTSVARGDVDLGAELRTMIADELRALDLRGVPPARAAILSASLVRMDVTASGATVSVACVLSATLRDAKRGVLFAVLEGRARGEDDPRRLRALERAAMQSAVRGALARVPEALGSTKRH
jgi:hypothetical protein